MTDELKHLYKTMVSGGWTVTCAEELYNGLYGIQVESDMHCDHDGIRLSGFIERQFVLFANPKEWPNG